MTNTSTEATVPTTDVDATEKATPASSVEYSAGVVRLGNIKPAAPEVEEATPDITGKGGDDLEKKSFADFGVTDPIVDALEDKGITHPFPIQALTLGPALERHDIIGQAKTGTGKTLGFGIPVLEDVIAPDEEGYEDLLNPNQPQALIILPTRELTKQVAQDLREAAKYLSTRIVEIYGGVAFEPQIEALERGAEIVVGTPGRLIDLLRKGHLHLSGVETVVLDEADEMLDLGFLPDVETLLGRVPENRHTMLFSATMPGPVVALARRFMVQPTHIRAQDPDDQNQTVNTVKQVIYRVHAMNKVEVVSRILQAEGRGRTVIFCRTKRTAARLGEDLTARGFAVGSLHGDLGQGAREQALRAFRNGKVDVLVATDVAARGIDVDDVTHVINYQCPEDEKIYIHRIGRTGRAGHSGTAVTFVDWDDTPRWSLISRPWAWACRIRSRPTTPPPTCSPTWTFRRARPVACRAPSARARAWTPRSSKTWAAPLPAPRDEAVAAVPGRVRVARVAARVAAVGVRRVALRLLPRTRRVRAGHVAAPRTVIAR